MVENSVRFVRVDHLLIGVIWSNLENGIETIGHWGYDPKWGWHNMTHRIHGAGIYGNMDPINIPPLC